MKKLEEQRFGIMRFSAAEIIILKFRIMVLTNSSELTRILLSFQTSSEFLLPPQMTLIMLKKRMQKYSRFLFVFKPTTPWEKIRGLNSARRNSILKVKRKCLKLLTTAPRPLPTPQKLPKDVMLSLNSEKQSFRILMFPRVMAILNGFRCFVATE